MLTCVHALAHAHSLYFLAYTHSHLHTHTHVTLCSYTSAHTHKLTHTYALSHTFPQTHSNACSSTHMSSCTHIQASMLSHMHTHELTLMQRDSQAFRPWWGTAMAHKSCTLISIGAALQCTEFCCTTEAWCIKGHSCAWGRAVWTLPRSAQHGSHC